ncbi:MAG: MoxR family ATPase [Bacteroidales bacterium]|nr:MoxR family ATPase [Bacteroidales bacterium]
MEHSNDIQALDQLKSAFQLLQKELGKVIVGQDQVVKEVLISIFSQGHCLLVGVPGLAKTLLVSSLSKVLGLDFSRIQFTPDLMPSDIVGTEILDENRQFKFVKGPIFTNFVLADEINRTPPKTQAALLEAMQEKSVTAAGVNYQLSKPFFVMATQNPIEQEGTYPLPEAQLDRFMFNVIVDYPSFDEELQIVKQTTSGANVSIGKVMTQEEILKYQSLIYKIPVNDSVIEYAVNLVSKTRPGSDRAPEIINNYVEWGAGPRASQFLIIGAKTHAALNGKYSPDIEDVKAVAYSILRHRISKNYKAEAEGLTIEKIIEALL